MEVVQGGGGGGAPAREGRRPPADEGPRERLRRLGASALTDSELVAVLLGTGLRGAPVMALAEALLDSAGGLKSLVMQDPHELSAMPGLGPAKAAALLAALELGRRVQRAEERRPRLSTADEIHRYLEPELSALPREVFHVLSLNSRNVLLRDARIAQGTVGACPVDPREVFAGALAARASAIILAHNHPSGDPEPSEQDVLLTMHVAEGARLLGMKLLDHLVVGDRRYVSLKQRRLIPPLEEGGRSWSAGGESR